MSVLCRRETERREKGENAKEKQRVSGGNMYVKNQSPCQKPAKLAFLTGKTAQPSLHADEIRIKKSKRRIVIWIKKKRVLTKSHFSRLSGLQ